MDPKARYALDQLLGHLLGWSVHFVTEASELNPEQGPCLVYGNEPVPGALWIKPCGWFGLDDLRSIDPTVTEWRGIPVLFATSEGDLGFDIVAASFFALARVDEWAKVREDEHGRPVTGDMHAARHGYLHRPIVDEWALLLAERWQELDPRVPVPVRAYRQVATIDLDNGFKYLGRSWWRTIGSWTRDLMRGELLEVQERWNVIVRDAPDPFVLDEAVLRAFSTCTARSIAFVLTADRGEWDHAVEVERFIYSAYLRRLAQRMEIGVHPSYRSSEAEGLIARERERLTKAIGGDVALSRQHFLRFRTPSTFREVINAGIKEEHSMGYHDRLGFRAGTCTPYKWYDLERDQATDLVIHPFCVMDNTLRHKLRLEPEAAVEEVRKIIAALRKVGGTFTGLWHESFLASAKRNGPWRDAIMRIIHEAAP